jgi:1,4-dihydroxy-6-naphthoate synthase
MGDGYGPIVVTASREGPSADASGEEIRSWLRNRKIAVPGRMTSAYLALQLYLGGFDHVVVPFDQIFEAVKSGTAAAGLIIHEGQLTYAERASTKWSIWANGGSAKPGCPCLGRKRSAEGHRATGSARFARDHARGIDYGLAHRAEAVAHSMPYARDMDAVLAENSSACM